MADAKDDFSYELRPLPPTKTVSLTDALSLALYGGLPTPIDSSTGSEVYGIVGGPIERDGRHIYFVKQDGNSRELSGPNSLDVAKPGALMFGIRAARAKRVPGKTDNVGTDSVSGEIANEDLNDFSLTPEDCAEFELRYADFEERLCNAAASGEVKFFGIKVQGSVINDGSDIEFDLLEIEAHYFSAHRGFDDNVIESHSYCATGLRPDRTEEDEQLLSSYYNVHLQAKGFLTFIRREYPAILDLKLQQRLLAVAEKERLAEKLAAHLIEALRDEKRIIREAALSIVGAPSVKSRWFIEIWGRAHALAKIDPKSGRPRKP